MVGNDVVDLGDGEVLAPRHPRFDERVFCPRERALLAASDGRERLRWILWAAKEAAYKLARKRDPRTVFSPPRFSVSLGERLRGRVAHAGALFEVAVRAERDLVHAVASDGSSPGERLLCGAAAAADLRDPSASVRDLAIRGVAAQLGVPEEDLCVERSARIPRLRARGRALDLSLSHHGRFVAFACDPVAA
jgi:hypothetical protein